MSRNPKQNQKRNFSAMTLEEAMQIVGQETMLRWQIDTPSQVPSDLLQANLQRLESFDLTSSEAAKALLIDAVFVEIVPLHKNLKVWKEATLNTDTLTGVADYLFAPKRAYLATPLLCVAEAKKDDFEKGQIQCIAEMVACQWLNRQRNQDVDVYGIVTNGQGWVFYKLTRQSEIYETDQYGLQSLSQLLGTLNYVCAECAKNVP